MTQAEYEESALPHLQVGYGKPPVPRDFGKVSPETQAGG